MRHRTELGQLVPDAGNRGEGKTMAITMRCEDVCKEIPDGDDKDRKG